MIISKKWDSEGHPDSTVNSSILDNILMLRGGHYWILIKNSLTETRSEEIYLLGPKWVDNNLVEFEGKIIFLGSIE